MTIAETFINKPVHDFYTLVGEIMENAVSVTDGNVYSSYVYDFSDGSQIECNLLDTSLSIGDTFRPFIRDEITLGNIDDWDNFSQMFTKNPNRF